jgi:hypothetical protein
MITIEKLLNDFLLATWFYFGRLNCNFFPDAKYLILKGKWGLSKHSCAEKPIDVLSGIRNI